MSELFADTGFPLDPVIENRIGFHFRMGDLESHHAVVAHIHGAVNRCHSAAGDRRLDAVGIDLCACFQTIQETHRDSYSVEGTYSTVSGIEAELTSSSPPPSCVADSVHAVQKPSAMGTCLYEDVFANPMWC